MTVNLGRGSLSNYAINASVRPTPLAVAMARPSAPRVTAADQPHQPAGRRRPVEVE